MVLTATVQSIGEHAVDPEEPILVLFDETATDDLKQIAIIQKFDASVGSLSLTVGSKLTIDDQMYTVAYAGELVAANLTSIGHATLYFKDVPAKPMANGVYLTPNQLPTIKVGSQITYQA